MSLSLRHVHLTYLDGDARLVALDYIALDVAPGRLVAITGPSGSGTSSLLAVAGLLKAPDSGRVVIGGQDTTELCRAERTRSRRERPGFVFQQSNLLPSLTAVEQLLMVTHVAGTTDRTTESQARNLLGDLGLGTHADRRAHGLSGGQRQRVGIARALMNAPNVLLVDEPTSPWTTSVDTTSSSCSCASSTSVTSPR